MATRKDNLAFAALLILYTLAIVAPVEFGTVAIQDVLPGSTMFDRTPLEEAVISHNLSLLILWPVSATAAFSALMSFLYRNKPSSPAKKGHN